MIYLDHNATTPVAPEAAAAMVEALACFGNPSSIHRAGRRARDLVERARGEVAALLGADPGELVLTSGGTEANNLGVLGAARAALAAGRARVIVTSALEHPSVGAACRELARDGVELRLVALGPDGRVTAEAVAEACAGGAALVALAAANHELGNRSEVAALAAAAHAAGALVHVDAVQLCGKAPVTPEAWGVDLCAVSAHKLYGPKGAGALWVRRGVELEERMVGGHQERERRAGTENVPAIAGFGAAARLAQGRGFDWRNRLAALRDRLEAAALAIPGARRHGDPAARDEGTTNLGWSGVLGELVVQGLDLDDVACSTGAACSSGRVEPSAVVAAVYGAPAAGQAVRLSLGWSTTDAEMERVTGLLPGIIARIRAA